MIQLFDYTTTKIGDVCATLEEQIAMFDKLIKKHGKKKAIIAVNDEGKIKKCILKVRSAKEITPEMYSLVDEYCKALINDGWHIINAPM